MRISLMLVVLMGGCELPTSGNAPSPGGVHNQFPETCPLFPADNPWNQSIASLPVHPRSDDYIASMGDRNLHPDFGANLDGSPFGIPFVVVGGTQAKVPVEFSFESESDPGPYPLPTDTPIERGADAHAIVVDEDECLVYEMFKAASHDGGSRWTADAGAIFDLESNEVRPDGWTSADAAGLPILPGLVLYDDVTNGAITHAIRMTVSRSQQGYVFPARHAAGTDNDAYPPMGLRLRLKSSYNCSGLSQEVQVMCEAFKTYGLIVADNGSSWYVSGAPDPRWNDSALRDLKGIPGSAFEAVDTGPITPF